MAEKLSGKEELVTRARLTLGEEANIKHFEAVFEKKKAKGGGRDFRKFLAQQKKKKVEQTDDVVMVPEE